MREVNQAVLLSWGTDAEINAPEPHPLHIKYDPCCQNAVIYCRSCFSIVSSLLHSELKEISFSPPAQPRHQHEKIMKCCASAMMDKQPGSSNCHHILCKITELTALAVESKACWFHVHVLSSTSGELKAISNHLAALDLCMTFLFSNSSLRLSAHAQLCACACRDPCNSICWFSLER